MVKTMLGMSAASGKELEGLDHLKQSIIDILTTSIGSRVMRRDYGSRLFKLVNRPITRDFTLEIYAATAEALGKWEKRFKLEKVKITEVRKGKSLFPWMGCIYQMVKMLTLKELWYKNCGTN